MTISEFRECVEYNIDHNIKHAVLGLGAPGVGKSQVIRQIGKKYGYKVIDIRLAQMSEVEIGGLIYPNESRTKTVWLAPEVLPNVERDGEHTILLLDEITSCTKRVQVAAYQLILDRRIGQYELPEGCFVVALGNREDDDGVYVRLSGPLADRFEIHYIEPDFGSWKNDYALKYGVHEYVVNYLTAKPTALHNQAVAGDSMVFATPRSWDRVSEILKFDSDVSKPVIQHKIIGNIGEAEGAQFIEFCKRQVKFVSADDFLQGTAAPDKPDELTILINAVLSKFNYLKNITSGSNLEPRERQSLENAIDRIVKLPLAEFAILGIKGLLDLNRAVVSKVFLEFDDPAVTTFMYKNSYALGLEYLANRNLASSQGIFGMFKKD